MSRAALATGALPLLDRLDSWAHRGAVRGLLTKVAVTVAGPLVILAGVAMLVLPGPGLVVIAAGLALLALEYDWARRVLAALGRRLARARDATLPRDGSRGRKAFGAALLGATAVVGFVATAAITAFLGAHTFL